MGETPLKSVVVHVRGASQDVGDIAAGESKSVSAGPGGESGLVIELKTAGGERMRSKTNFNLEAGYSGFILVRMKDGWIAHAEKDY